MTESLAPLDILFDSVDGTEIQMPQALADLYGRLAFPLRPGSPYIISNFVSSLDGVAALDTKGMLTGDLLSGSSDHDSCVMGILRALSDVIIVGAGTLAASPQHIWTPDHIYPSYTRAYKKIRDGLGRQEPLLNVIVTGQGNIDPSLPLFQSGAVQVLIVTTRSGLSRLNKMDFPAWVRVVAGDNSRTLTSQEILEAVVSVRPSASIVLVEGGPHLVGTFFAEHSLNELFLTLSPQVAGRSAEEERLGIVAGAMLSPGHPDWGVLVSVRKGGSHLFLRYMFRATEKIYSTSLHT